MEVAGTQHAETVYFNEQGHAHILITCQLEKIHRIINDDKNAKKAKELYHTFGI